MNRRELAKLAAAAAAGSVAARPSGFFDGHKIGFDAGWDAGFAAQTIALQRSARHLEAVRLQQAIELGDRTAAELGGLYWNLIRAGALGRWQAIILSGTPFVVAGSADDPDPLTAVQKARDAALEWKARDAALERRDGKVWLREHYDAHLRYIQEHGEST